jgi:hypothetical protein
MTNIEKEMITYAIITRGTRAELGTPAQDPYAKAEGNLGHYSVKTLSGFFARMMHRVLKTLRISKPWGPNGPQTPVLALGGLK